MIQFGVNAGAGAEITLECPPGYLIQGMSSYDNGYCFV